MQTHALILGILSFSAGLVGTQTIWGLNVLGSLDGNHNKKYLFRYITSTIIGAILTGIGMGILGELISSMLDFNFRVFILTLLLLFLFVLEIFDKTSILPNGKFTIPSNWIYAAKENSSILWGLTLGLGFITYASGALWHAYLLTILLFGNIKLGILTGVLYALGRTVLPSFKKIREIILNMQQKECRNSNYLKMIRRSYSIFIFLLVLILSLNQF